MLEVNPLYYDVPQAHLLAAIDAQLDQLDKAGAIISSSVSTRVQEYRSRLEDLKKRLQIARTKIGMIAQSKQGIVIYSAGSYPVPREKQEENFKRLFPLSPLEPARELEEIHRPPIVSSRLAEGLKFLHVKPPTSDLEENIYKLPPKGLGSFHRRGIKNVADLLLFNSAINPYSEELPTPERSPTPVEEEALPPSTMGAALSFPSQLTDENVDGLLYDPGKSSTPQLQLPANLAFGDGFVTDLPALSPSPRAQASALATPPLFSPTASTQAFQQPPDLNEMDNLPLLPGVFDTELSLPEIVPRPPPMPPSMPIAPIHQTAAAAGPPRPPPPMPVASSTPAPPPPPPAPTMPAAQVAPMAIKSSSAPAGDRASLLDSIRNHGGLRGLKSVKETAEKLPTKKPVQAPKDHMAQLKERLQRIGEISAGPRPRPPEINPPPPESANIMEEMLNRFKSKDIVGSDSDDSDKEKDDEEWDS